jgi:hypothetical protein
VFWPTLTKHKELSTIWNVFYYTELDAHDQEPICSTWPMEIRAQNTPNTISLGRPACVAFAVDYFSGSFLVDFQCLQVDSPQKANQSILNRCFCIFLKD